MWRTLMLLLTLGLLIGLLAAANLLREPGTRTLDWQLLKAPAREVVLETPAMGSIVQTITAPGEVELVTEVQIASQIVGRVVDVLVEDGDTVKGPVLDDQGREIKPGQLLVRLDRQDAMTRLSSTEARIERLRAAIDQSKTDRDKASRDLSRIIELAGRGVVTPTELADSRTLLDKAQAVMVMSMNELVESESMRDAARLELEYTEIRSPIDGEIADLDVEKGEVVIAGTTNLPGTVLMTVGDPRFKRVRVDIDETDVPLLATGQPARIYLLADPTRAINGVVQQVAPKGTKGTDQVVTFETLIQVESDDPSLLPGMTATVEIEVRRADGAMGVPVQAVVQRRLKDLPDTAVIRSWADSRPRTPGDDARTAESRYVKLVFVAEDGVARALPVETGISDEQRVEVLSGLSLEDRVIVGPFRSLDELKDGDPVVEETEKKDTGTASGESP